MSAKMFNNTNSYSVHDSLITSISGEENGVAQLVALFYDTSEVFVKTWKVIYKSLALHLVQYSFNRCVCSSIADSVCSHVYVTQTNFEQECLIFKFRSTERGVMYEFHSFELL
jgi:hypothetical protein